MYCHHMAAITFFPLQRAYCRHMAAINLFLIQRSAIKEYFDYILDHAA